MRSLRAVALLPLYAYRKLVSPLIGPRCRYYPTCSTYAVGAVGQYGVARGSVLAAWRLLRCNPFSDGGFDHVEDQKLFRKATHGAPCDHSHKDTVAAR
ncbi:MAG: membrane protein insertion efficiency factor YidD [Solirubrobacterales bacterium]